MFAPSKPDPEEEKEPFDETSPPRPTPPIVPADLARGLEVFFKAIRKHPGRGGVPTEEIDLEVCEEAQMIDVRGADRHPVVVNDRRLGVQDAGLVLEYLDPGTEERAISCLPGPTSDSDVGHSGGQETDVHPAPRRLLEGTAYPAVWYEIGVCDQDPFLRVNKGGEIFITDRADSAQSVA